jgi:hypothetical protein
VAVNANVAPAPPVLGVIRRLGAELGVAPGVVAPVDAEKAAVVDVGRMIATSAVDDVVLGSVVDDDFDDDFDPPEPPHAVTSTVQMSTAASRGAVITLLSRRGQ